MRDKTKRQRTFSRRMFLLGGLKFSLLGLILGRFYYLQIHSKARYLELSEKNITRIDIIPPRRGIIYDRNSLVIADNRRIYNAVVRADYIKDVPNIIKKVVTILGRDVALTIEDFVQYKKLMKDGISDILIESGLSWLDISKLELAFIGLQYKGFEIAEDYKRNYPYSNLLSHVLGYVSKPTIKEIHDSNKQNYRNFNTGKSGVEKALDAQLQGRPGERKFVVNAVGKRIKEMPIAEGIVGNSITLTIDVEIQQNIRHVMKSCAGSVVVMNPYTGEVVGLYSAPDYDPNLFVSGMPKDRWDRIFFDPKKPMLNRAVTALYPPGSTFKLVTALAILQAGITENETIFCNGHCAVGNRVFHCWKNGGHGNVNLGQAIAKSCNIYFCLQGLKIGIDHIARTANLLGLGAKTGIYLPYESAGCVPDKNWKKRTIHKSWTRGDTVNTSVGQGYVLVTLLQLAVMLSRLITGKKVCPALLYGGNNFGIKDDLNIKNSHRRIIMDGMYDVFDIPGGTGHAYRSNSAELKIAGKTGTAQIISRRKDIEEKFKEHGIFVGFAPFKKPKYVVSAIVEHGGWGGSSALVVARELLLDLCRENL